MKCHKVPLVVFIKGEGTQSFTDSTAFPLLSCTHFLGTAKDTLPNNAVPLSMREKNMANLPKSHGKPDDSSSFLLSDRAKPLGVQ